MSSSSEDRVLSTTNRSGLARILYQQAIRGRLDRKYEFIYFYLTRSNRWASASYSKDLIREREEGRSESGYDRIVDLKHCDVLYSTLMGPCGENGNIMGLTDLLNIPIIGCGILASSLVLDKFLSKLLDEKIGVPDEILKEIGFPCFVKPPIWEPVLTSSERTIGTTSRRNGRRLFVTSISSRSLQSKVPMSKFESSSTRTLKDIFGRTISTTPL